MKIEDLSKEQVAYILHRYYPEHRDNLTPLDWQIFLILTNYLCGSKHLPGKYSDVATYKKLKCIVEYVFNHDGSLVNDNRRENSNNRES